MIYFCFVYMFQPPFTISCIIFFVLFFLCILTLLPDLRTAFSVSYRINKIFFLCFVFEAVVFAFIFILCLLMLLFLFSRLERKYRTQYHPPSSNFNLCCAMFSWSKLVDWLFTLFRSLLSAPIRLLLLLFSIFFNYIFAMDAHELTTTCLNKQIAKWLCIEQTRMTVDFQSVNNNAF